MDASTTALHILFSEKARSPLLPKLSRRAPPPLPKLSPAQGRGGRRSNQPAASRQGQCSEGRYSLPDPKVSLWPLWPYESSGRSRGGGELGSANRSPPVRSAHCCFRQSRRRQRSCGPTSQSRPTSLLGRGCARRREDQLEKQREENEPGRLHAHCRHRTRLAASPTSSQSPPSLGTDDVQASQASGSANPMRARGPRRSTHCHRHRRCRIGHRLPTSGHPQTHPSSSPSLCVSRAAPTKRKKNRNAKKKKRRSLGAH